MIHSDTNLPPRLVGAIRHYLGSRTVQRPVSIERMLRTARHTIPDLAASDDELADLIARALIHEGCDIDFDHVGQRYDLEPAHFDAELPWRSRARRRR